MATRRSLWLLAIAVLVIWAFIATFTWIGHGSSSNGHGKNGGSGIISK